MPKFMSLMGYILADTFVNINTVVRLAFRVKFCVATSAKFV